MNRFDNIFYRYGDNNDIENEQEQAIDFPIVNEIITQDETLLFIQYSISNQKLKSSIKQLHFI